MAEVCRAVIAARSAFDEGESPWLAPSERAAAMRRLADALDRQAPTLATLGVEENGYPVGFAEGFMAVMPSTQFRINASVAQTFPFEEERESETHHRLIRREPVGVVAALPACNGPLTLGAQKVAPAIAAGCTVILKAPLQDPLACYVLADAAEEAGIPPGVINVILADVEESQYLVSHRGVDAVSFTGSTSVGKLIAKACARDVRRCTLELGGNPPQSCSRTSISTSRCQRSWRVAFRCAPVRCAHCIVESWRLASGTTRSSTAWPRRFAASVWVTHGIPQPRWVR